MTYIFQTGLLATHEERLTSYKMVIMLWTGGIWGKEELLRILEEETLK